ncbi:hypothetical protein PIB30_056801 [Stylosanthes scabra]|uniref:Uncharacterized protein n=1 Tax=Stylosanthes scabra TaxID=79078 RepID=A0ABU6RJK0_9FABA|nr:hypothetical protein [Stylosanthes scabra]
MTWMTMTQPRTFNPPLSPHLASAGTFASSPCCRCRSLPRARRLSLPHSVSLVSSCVSPHHSSSLAATIVRQSPLFVPTSFLAVSLPWYWFCLAVSMTGQLSSSFSLPMFEFLICARFACSLLRQGMK